MWIAFPEIETGEAGAMVLDAVTGRLRAILRFGSAGPVQVAPDRFRDRLYVAWPVEGRLDVASLRAW